MNKSTPIRVVIADDQAIVRSGLGAFVMAYDQLHLVGEAKDGEEAIELCEKVQPDVVLMDLKMPRMDGITATRVIRQRWPKIHVLVLTSFRDNTMVQGALDAGATGYLLKDISADELADAIMQVYQGRRMISQEASQAIVSAEHLQRLEEAIGSANPGTESLKKLLAEHLPLVYPGCQIQVRLLPDKELYTQESLPPHPVVESAWRWLRMADGARLFRLGDEYPWGGVHPPGTSLALAPVPALHGGQPPAGISILFKGDIEEQEEVLRTVQYLARLIAPVVDPGTAPAPLSTQQRATQELEMAWRIQEGILPDGAPVMRGWDVAARLEPAHETSGDFYDFIPLPHGKWAIVIADVTDKGLGAAVFMALCSTLIRTYAARYPTLPAIAMNTVNERILSDTRGSLFVTAFYAILEPDIGRLRYVNAGHNPPFLISPLKSKRVDRLSRTGMPLGISQEATWQQKIVKFAPGDTLVLYTDGITEAQNRMGTMFGDQRLLDVIRTKLGKPAQEIQEAVLRGVQSFTGGAPKDDDIALVVLTRKA
jgi:DNA-binding NarL/FixJ family response regulator